ncbi:SIMPL domain-containing protein [Seonamhaeicola marinus]|uniref:DUF541 domain-containing protein n=1 Tax=Seonamhaeicola marinus TaxID=1912246 RepID=A0A5D0HUJ2_9FLAO|nr:SIMPL domain-containing protein [Seonamhaeicola marinus]TYA74580.1 DUF541 domain-containing protein [Seonamhaeicola marinus]
MKIIKSFIVIALFSNLMIGQNGAKNFIDQPYIEVIGKVETEIIPNEIYLKININENDKKGKLSVEVQENQLINALTSLGIDIDKNFSILNFDGYYQRKFLASNEVSKIKNYQLIINDGKTLGKVYQALDRIDISNVSIIKTSHSNIENIRRDTKLKALKVARDKANQYAEVINQTIGKALYIQEITENRNTYGANSINIRGANTAYGYSSPSLAKIQDLNVKSIIISESVHAKFSLN